MATSTYRFFDYYERATFTGGVQVSWSYNQSAKTITINSISYVRNQGWYVGSGMKFGIKWSDGQEQVLAEGTYNLSGGNYIVTSDQAGFITISGVLGVFSDANNKCPITHTFSGSSGGFTVWFGSTRGTLNAGNPAPYHQLDLINGSNPSITFSTPPGANCATHALTNPSLFKITDSISGIDWGTGASSKRLTATVSYSFMGVTYSYQAYSSTSPGSSASFTIDAYNDAEPWKRVPPGSDCTVTWRIETNLGTVSCSKTIYTSAPTGPSISSVSVSNPRLYDLVSSATGVSYGNYYKSRSLTATVKGAIDGNTIDWTGYSNTSGATSGSFDYDAAYDAMPWLRVPDGEDVTVTWTAVVDVGYTKLTATISKVIYCMMQYDAYVIESGVNDDKPVAATLMVSNTVGSQPNKEIRRVTQIDG